MPAIPLPSIRSIHPPNTTAKWVTAATLWFAVVGALVPITIHLIYFDLLSVAPFAAIAGGLLGGPLWWGIAERGKVTYPRGIFVGFLVAILAHPVTYFVSFLLLDSGQMFGLSDITDSAFNAFFFGIWTIPLLGWVTVPYVCLSAVLLVVVRRRFA